MGIFPGSRRLTAGVVTGKSRLGCLKPGPPGRSCLDLAWISLGSRNAIVAVATVLPDVTDPGGLLQYPLPERRLLELPAAGMPRTRRSQPGPRHPKKNSDGAGSLYRGGVTRQDTRSKRTLLSLLLSHVVRIDRGNALFLSFSPL